MGLRLSAELSLVATCCRWPLDDRVREAIDDAAAGGIDWALFEQIVYRNRVVPLVSHALSWSGVELPAAIAERLAQRAQACARRSLVMARESLRLQRAFDGAGVPLMVVKGAPLAVLAYGGLGLKDSWDIDLLVPPEDAARSVRLLTELGYRGDLATIGPRQLEAYLTYGKEAQFERAAPAITAELHWRLTDNPRLLRDVAAAVRSQSVPMPGGRLRTLADEDLLTYLCVHGTFHNWGRLKWLADVGALLGGREPQAIADLHEAAATQGAGRSTAVALLLCRELLGLSLDAPLVRRLEGDRMTRALVKNAIAGLAYRGGTVETRPYSWPWLRLIAAHFLATDKLGHRLEQCRVLWNAPEYRSSISLPRGFGFGYHFVRLPLWAWRVSARTAQRLRA